MKSFFCYGILSFIFEIALPPPSMAYIDPGSTGILAQLLYVLFYGALGTAIYYFRSIKQFFAKLKQSIANLFRH